MYPPSASMPGNNGPVGAKANRSCSCPLFRPSFASAWTLSRFVSKSIPARSPGPSQIVPPRLPRRANGPPPLCVNRSRPSSTRPCTGSSKSSAPTPRVRPSSKPRPRSFYAGYGLTRPVARTLLEQRGNRDRDPAGPWVLRLIPDHPTGKAFGVYLAGEEDEGKRYDGNSLASDCISVTASTPADGSTPSGKRSQTLETPISLEESTLDLSPQPGYAMAERDSPDSEQGSGSAGGVGPFAADPPSSDSPDDATGIHENNSLNDRELDLVEGSAVAAGPPTPPPFCEGCGRPACWLIRPDYYECAPCQYQWRPPRHG